MGKTLQILDISIRAHIKMPDDIGEVTNILNAVQAAHLTRDYSGLLKLPTVTIDETKVNLARRRFDDTQAEAGESGEAETDKADVETTEGAGSTEDDDAKDVPKFLREGKARGKASEADEKTKLSA